MLPQSSGEDSGSSDTDRLVSLLSWLGDVPTHRKLAARERMNGMCDLADIIEMWSDTECREELSKCLRNEWSRSALLEIFDALDDVYCAPGYPDFGWMYFGEPAPTEWNEATSKAAIILEREFPRALSVWREADRPAY
jgi:hypothetical protein